MGKLDKARYEEYLARGYDPKDARTWAKRPEGWRYEDGEGGCLPYIGILCIIPAGLAVAIACPPLGLLIVAALVVWLRRTA